jgi:hypothetical protein
VSGLPDAVLVTDMTMPAGRLGAYTSSDASLMGLDRGGKKGMRVRIGKLLQFLAGTLVVIEIKMVGNGRLFACS